MTRDSIAEDLLCLCILLAVALVLVGLLGWK